MVDATLNEHAGDDETTGPAAGGGRDRAMTRRGVIRAAGVGAAGLALAGLAVGPVAAQDATPEAEADPVADPEAGGGTPSGEGGELTIYSGRNENLVGPLLERFGEESGIDAEVRYAGTSELAATLLEEGENTPAGAFLAQDAGALGLLAAEGLLQPLPEELLNRVDERFRSPDGLWVGVSGRARVLVYNTDAVEEADLPASVRDLTDPRWRGQVGWAPENASFQSFVTAFRQLDGDEATREWLEGMLANEPVNFADSNAQVVAAVGAGEISVGLANHYYLYAAKEEEGEDFPIANHFFAAGDPGSLVNVAGVGILAGTEDEA
ncbi:MAG: Ferric iron ABC transporter, iron-binding protein, partial [uncultured Thermomicrobiales bacterium]